MRTRIAMMLFACCLWSVALAQSTRVLTGRVLDAQGKPVAGAQVYYYPNLLMAWVGVPPERLPSTTTDEQGRYRLTGSIISPNSPVAGVVAFHPQYGCNTVRFGQPLARELHLQPLQEFQGKVVNVEGQPVAGATVRLAFISLGGDEVIVLPPVPPFVAQTDGAGAFRLPASPQMQRLMLVVTAPGCEPLVFNNVTWERVSKEELPLTLKAGARVTAQLVHAGSGEPVRDFPVMAAPYPTYTTTGADGRVTLEVGTGTVTLMPGFSLTSPSMVPPGTFAPLQVEKVQPGTTVDLGVIRVYTEPVVTIEVRDENGRPVPFCAVDVRSTDGPREAAFVLPYFTDTRGQLRLPLAEGRYQITASGPASGDRYYTSREVREVVVQEGQVKEAQPVVVQVTATRIGRPRQAKIQVRTASGQPPKKVWVQMGGISFEGLEESDIRWRPYRLDGDTLTLELIGLEGRLDRVFVMEPVLWEGTVLRHMSVDNPPKQMRLQPLPRVYGRVIDGSGKPVVGAKVSLVFGSEGTFPGGSGRAWSEAVVPVATSTDKTGRFSLPLLPEGKCWAVVTRQGYGPAVVTLLRGQTATVRLRRASAEYAGVLVDAYGEPVAKERIFVRYTFPNSQTPQNRQQRLLPTREVPIGQVVTDEAGRFALKSMPSSLVLAVRGENLPGMRLRVQPSRELVLVRTTQRPLWETAQQPVVPDVEKLLRAVEWLQPVGWQGKQTVLVFTAPYLSGNEQILRALQQRLHEGWQIAVVLDTTSRAEAETYRRALGIDVPFGYWKRSPSRPKAPSLALVVPGLPYLVHLSEEGKPVRLGFKVEELNRLLAQGE